jgi:hypothetical protein
MNKFHLAVLNHGEIQHIFVRVRPEDSVFFERIVKSHPEIVLYDITEEWK